jgi:hypothetical protein
MYLKDVNIDSALRARVQAGIQRLSEGGMVSGVHHNDGVLVEVHADNYVELILRYVQPRMAPRPEWVVTALAMAGLQVESNCDRGWNRDKDKAGARWCVAYEVGVSPATDAQCNLRYEPDYLEFVQVYDHRR